MSRLVVASGIGFNLFTGNDPLGELHMPKKIDHDFARSALLALVVEMVDAKEHLNTIEVTIAALAKEYGISIPEAA
jgi:hypothetical protein